MVELPLRTKLMTDSELYEATRKELAFFMEETVRIQSELTAANVEIERLRHKTCQAYQVIGCLGLMDEPELPNEKEVVRAMDYFADDQLFSEEFLPFNPFEKQDV